MQMDMYVRMILDTAGGNSMVVQRDQYSHTPVVFKGFSLVGTMFILSDGVSGTFLHALFAPAMYLTAISCSRQSRPFPDPLVKVYDLRTMRPLPPLPFSDGPAFINSLPRKDSSIVIVSNQGLINIADISNPNASEFYQVCPFTMACAWKTYRLLAGYHIDHQFHRRLSHWRILGLR
jgi:hypothetical protein